MPQPSEWDRLVNSKWPDVVPKPTAQEAVTGAKRLYRHIMGKPFKGAVKVTSGNRYSWIRSGTLIVNPDHGWNGFRGIIHLLAHYLHHRKHPGKRPHHYTELEIEKRMTDYAIQHGFHLGKLKSKAKPKVKPTKLEKAQAAYEATLEKISAWQGKQKRAEKAISKYRKKARYYKKIADSTPFTLS